MRNLHSWVLQTEIDKLKIAHLENDKQRQLPNPTRKTLRISCVGNMRGTWRRRTVGGSFLSKGVNITQLTPVPVVHPTHKYFT